MQLQADSYELPYNLYDIIGDKADIKQKSDGLDQEAIQSFYLNGYQYPFKSHSTKIMDFHLMQTKVGRVCRS